MEREPADATDGEHEASDDENMGQERGEEAIPPAETVSFVCETCGVGFSRKTNRDRHVRLRHNNISLVYDCGFCGAFYNTAAKLREHRQSHKPSTGFEAKASAFRKSCVVYRKIYGEKMTSLEQAFDADKEEMLQLISFEVSERKSMKVGIIYHVEFARLHPQLGGGTEEGQHAQAVGNEAEDSVMEGEEEEEEERGNAGEVEGENDAEHVDEGGESNNDSPTENENEPRDISVADAEEVVYEICLRAPSALVTTATNIGQVLHNAHQRIQNRVDDFVENGSGWRLNAVICADVELGTCAALNGSCNLVAIEYLRSFDNTRRTPDMQRCFLHACAFHFVKSENLMKLDRFIKKYFLVHIPSPVMVKDIARFERDNGHLNFKINVVYLEEKKIFPLIFSKKLDAEHHITLLLYKTEVQGKVVSHYSYVKDVNKLLRKCYIRDTKYSYEKTLSCLNCFSKFCAQGGGKANLERHYELCSKNKPQAVKIPEAGSTIQFKNHLNKFQSHFIGFFDFESCHRKQEFECSKCEMVSEGDNTACHHQTLTKAVQEPITYSYLIMDKAGSIVYNNTYTGRDCVKRFLEELISIEADLLAVLNANVELNMSAEDEELFATASHCHICDIELEDDRVRDHCHVSGRFLGAAHNLCNLGRAERKTIPLFCHNLTG